jgi:hypothetical protein
MYPLGGVEMGYSSWGCINSEARSGYHISPLSLWGEPPVSVTLVVSCVVVFYMSLGPALGIHVCPGVALKFHYAHVVSYHYSYLAVLHLLYSTHLLALCVLLHKRYYV